MKKPFRVILLVVGTSFLSLGTVVQRKDAIRRTQTDPVSYKEKVKEEVEGKKGPPAPTLDLFPKERFLYEGPVEKAKQPAATPAQEETEFWLDENEEKAPIDKEGLEEGEFKLEGETDDTREDPVAKPKQRPVS